jgi:hypothetical protein
MILLEGDNQPTDFSAPDLIALMQRFEVRALVVGLAAA